MDSGIWDQVGLELSDIDVEGTIESEGGSQGGADLGDEAVEVGVDRAVNIQVAAAHVVESLVIKAESNIGVLKEGVGGEDVVIWLDNSCSNLRSRSNCEGQLGFAAILHGKALQKKSSETGSGSTTRCMEHQKALEAGAMFRNFCDTVKNKINNLLSNGVVTAGKVIGGILFAANNLIRMVKFFVDSSANFIAHSGLKIHVNSTRNMLTR